MLRNNRRYKINKKYHVIASKAWQSRLLNTGNIYFKLNLVNLPKFNYLFIGSSDILFEMTKGFYLIYLLK